MEFKVKLTIFMKQATTLFIEGAKVVLSHQIKKLFWCNLHVDLEATENVKNKSEFTTAEIRRRKRCPC